MTDLFDFQAQASDFAVFGDPIAHSLSPRIHQLFAAQFGIALTYRRVQVDAGGFAQAVSHFAAHGGRGLNITLPYKVEAWRLCQQRGNSLSPRAQRAEAVNTLKFSADGVFGDNTDGVGLVRDIAHNLGAQIAGREVLVLGAGGAVRGILAPLLECAPKRVTIFNRTAAKARELAQKFLTLAEAEGVVLRAWDGESAADETPAFGLIINATAASVKAQLPDNLDAGWVDTRSVIYDMMYAKQPSPFMAWAQRCGAEILRDGLGMLVEQAAESFYLWHDLRPATAEVIDTLRAELVSHA